MAPAQAMQNKLGIFAGGGAIPLRLADACLRAPRAFVILGLKGFADAAIEAHPHHWVGIGEAGKAFDLLRKEGAKDIVFCGRVTRPNFKDMHVDWEGIKILPRLAAAGARGDDALLGFIVKEMETRGFRVVGPNDVLQDLLAPRGLLTKKAPGEDDLRDIERARDVVATLGSLDIGQGAVIARGLVLAVEAAEGTDRMLERVAALPDDLRGHSHDRRGVLLKMSKPGQERRIDLPTVGLETMQRAITAGLSGIAVEANGALMLQREAMVAAADAAGLFLIGIERREP